MSCAYVPECTLCLWSLSPPPSLLPPIHIRTCLPVSLPLPPPPQILPRVDTCVSPPFPTRRFPQWVFLYPDTCWGSSGRPLRRSRTVRRQQGRP